MASTNYKLFNEDNSESRTYNDSEYDKASQRQTGVIPGMALSRMHNKMFLQWSAMSKAVADAIVASGHDCYDNDVSGIIEGLQNLIKTGGGNVAKELLKEHDDDQDVHSALTATVDDTLAPTSDENTIRTLLSNLANEIKQNKGTDDWKTASATNLATLASLVGNLASGSDVTWEGNKFTNAKLGIKGLMDQNGYICFGKNFGGLILQWGSQDSESRSITFQLSFNEYFGIFLTGWWGIAIREDMYNTGFKYYILRDSFNPYTGKSGCFYFAVGR